MLKLGARRRVLAAPGPLALLLALGAVVLALLVANASHQAAAAHLGDAAASAVAEAAPPAADAPECEQPVPADAAPCDAVVAESPLLPAASAAAAVPDSRLVLLEPRAAADAATLVGDAGRLLVRSERLPVLRL